MALTENVLIGGLSSVAIVSIGAIVGVIFYIKARKMDLKLLKLASVMIFFTTLFYLGTLTDFLVIFFLGHNMSNQFGQHAIIGFMFIPPALVIAIYIAAELITPDKKRVIVSIYIIFGILFEFFLIVFPFANFEFPPHIPGDELIESEFILEAPVFIIAAIFIVSLIAFNGIGFFAKSFKAPGKIKTKFRYLSLGFILAGITFTFDAIFDVLVSPIADAFIDAISTLFIALFIYLGLKTT